MKVRITKTAIIECENQNDIDLIRLCLQNGITHGSFVNEEVKIISALERHLLK